MNFLGGLEKEEASSAKKKREELLECPVCEKMFGAGVVERHIDECLTFAAAGKVEEEERSGKMQREDSLLLINCNYLGCGKEVEICDFYVHSLHTHSKEKQDVPCPVCLMMGESTEVSDPNYNLLLHLQQNHSEFLSGKHEQNEEEDVRTQFDWKEEFIKSFSDGECVHVEKVISAPMEKECSICFEDFKAGDKISTLSCFCIYHSKCIFQWWEQTKKKTCPTPHISLGKLN